MFWRVFWQSCCLGSSHCNPRYQSRTSALLFCVLPWIYHPPFSRRFCCCWPSQPASWRPRTHRRGLQSRRATRCGPASRGCTSPRPGKGLTCRRRSCPARSSEYALRTTRWAFRSDASRPMQVPCSGASMTSSSRRNITRRTCLPAIISGASGHTRVWKRKIGLESLVASSRVRLFLSTSSRLASFCVFLLF